MRGLYLSQVSTKMDYLNCKSCGLEFKTPTGLWTIYLNPPEPMEAAKEVYLEPDIILKLVSIVFVDMELRQTSFTSTKVKLRLRFT